MTEIPSVGHELQNQQEERFKGAPTELGILQIDYYVPDSRVDMIRHGVIDFNGGLAAAHDKTKNIIHIVPQDDAEEAFGNKYQHGSANVPLTGGDTDGHGGGPYAHKLVSMRARQICRQKGIMGRTVDAGNGYEMLDLNPFDQGQYVDITNVVEITTDGKEVKKGNIIDELASRNPDTSVDLDQIGTFNIQNDVIAWVTPEGKIQIAPNEEDMVNRLVELGYIQTELDVPHANDETTKKYQTRNIVEEFGLLKLERMALRDETMTMTERNGPEFKDTIIPPHLLHLIKR